MRLFVQYSFKCLQEVSGRSGNFMLLSSFYFLHINKRLSLHKLNYPNLPRKDQSLLFKTCSLGIMYGLLLTIKPYFPSFFMYLLLNEASSSCNTQLLEISFYLARKDFPLNGIFRNPILSQGVLIISLSNQYSRIT